MTHPEPMLSLQDVSKIYRLDKSNSVTAVNRVTLGITEGEFVIITGRSGSGKTTLLNLMAGLTLPTSGRVFLGRAEVWRLPDREQSALRNQKIGFVFQFPSLMPSLTALENVVLPTIAIRSNGHYGSSARERAVGLLQEVGLADKLHAYPRQLSAGQQQRVVVARSLINEPQLILADEPTSNLDEETEREIMALFRDIHRQRHVTLVLVTHTTKLLSYGNRALRMARGEIVQ